MFSLVCVGISDDGNNDDIILKKACLKRVACVEDMMFSVSDQLDYFH